MKLHTFLQRLGLGLLISTSLASAGGAQQMNSPLRVSINDTLQGGTANVQTRFNLYKQMGIGLLRVDLGNWQGMAQQAGAVPSVNAGDAANWQIVSQNGFKLKDDIGSMSGPPAWFFQAHPDAQMTNSVGATSPFVISYWYPGLHDLLEQQDDAIFAALAKQGVLQNVNYLVIPFGPAAEPIYPAQYGFFDANGLPEFWFYDPNAQADFPLRMQEKYGSIAAANKAWKTKYTSWGSVSIPKPGTVTGKMWDDVLTWYRNSKRRFITWQMAHYQRLVKKYFPEKSAPKMVVLVPGNHITKYEWQQAVASGTGDASMVIMTDSEFLLDTAEEFHAVAQYTGLPNITEIEYLHHYIVSHNYALPLWGENAGNLGPPSEQGAEVLATCLYGMEYIGSNQFAADGVTPTPILGQIQQTFSYLNSVWNGSPYLVTWPANGVLQIAQGTCLALDATGASQFCLGNDGTLSLQKAGETIWSNGAPSGSAANCQPTGGPNNTCFAVFQGDGNFVVYKGNTPLWATGTNGAAQSLALSATAPNLAIADGSGNIIWQQP